MDNLINLDALSKPITALIDAVSRGIGTLYEPTRIQRNAKAKAEEIVIIAEAEKKKNDILKAAQSQLNNASKDDLEAVVSRIVGKELNRQKNIDSIAQIAFDDLRKAKIISNQKVETDWLSRFFNYVKDVSAEELRYTWGKILSQEIQSPGSYSLRTLNVISCLSKKEADLFTKLGDYILISSTSSFLIRKGHKILGSDLTYEEILILMECGFIKETHNLSLDYEFDKKQNLGFRYQDLVIIIEKGEGVLNFSIPIYQLTTAGTEIYNILKVQKKLSYIREVATYLNNDKLRLGCSKLISMKDGIIETEDDITYL